MRNSRMRCSPFASALALSACALPAPKRSSTDTTPLPTPVVAPAVPQQHATRFRFTTSERFDAAAVPAYRGSHPEIYAHIDANRARHLENLRRWLKQPSVSAQNIGIREMAEMLREDLRRIGFREAELVPTSGPAGSCCNPRKLYIPSGTPFVITPYRYQKVQLSRLFAPPPGRYRIASTAFAHERSLWRCDLPAPGLLARSRCSTS